jgi:ubiquinol-cytochrome c reductase cytochrome c subunit
MKHFSTLLVAVAGTLAAGMLAVPYDAGAQAAGDAARGKAAFMKYGCYECHGTVGQGNLSAAPGIAPHPIAYPNFLAYIRAPRRDMPPYSAKILPDNVAQDIHAYLESIPAGPKPNTIALLRGFATGPSSPQLAHGREIFEESCQKCHAAAPIGPPLGNVKARLSLDQTIDRIKNPRGSMPKLFPSALSDRDVGDVAAYVQSL